MPVSEDGDPICEREHLADDVGDEEDRKAGIAKAAQMVEELFRLLLAQRCGWLVEDDQLRVAVESLRDFDELSITDAEGADQRPRPD